MYKICKKCGALKTVDKFHKSTTHKSGLRNECSACTSALKWLKNPKIKLLKFVRFTLKVTVINQIYCFKCSTRKDISEFATRSDSPSGIFYRCKPCVRNARDLEVKRASDRNYYVVNCTKVKSLVKKYRLDNPHKIAELSARNRAIRKRATPNWLTDEQKAQINDTYWQRAVKSKETGIEHHVDHIVPIKGDKICGLHVPWNLRVIPARQNLRKRNKMEDINASKDS